MKHRYVIEFANGDKWYALSIADNHVGHMTNISYINKDIKSTYIDYTIKPATTAMPFQAFHYYTSQYGQLLINESKRNQVDGIPADSTNK